MTQAVTISLQPMTPGCFQSRFSLIGAEDGNGIIPGGKSSFQELMKEGSRGH